MAFLQLKNISKHFSGVHALRNVSFSVEQGEVHAICGENGAGKSTLIKILGGIYPAHSFDGEVLFEGSRTNFSGIKDAEEAGVVVIHQELALVKYMSVAENIFLGREPNSAGVIDYHKMYSDTSSLLQQLGLNINPQKQVVELGIGEQQLVEIAKAINKKARILILDEPTTALSEKETSKLLGIIRELKAKGVTCVYISHKLGEVLSIADCVTVMRDGQYIATKKVSEITERELVSQMVGREITDFYPKRNLQRGEVLMSVKDFSLFDPDIPDKKKIDHVSFDIYRGEILGIAGLMGAGRTELLTGLFGAWNGKKSGEVMLKGKVHDLTVPQKAIENYIALVPEDRKRHGLLTESSINTNLNLASLLDVASGGLVRGSKASKRSKETIIQVGIRCKDAEVEVKTLSGGNQQKVVLGKWLLTNPDILFLDEPTRGVDVGAKAEIYELMNQMVSKGMAVVMVSSDLPEVIGMSDRVLVLHEGKLGAEFIGKAISQEQIMMAATGQN
ncbi:MAG: xylose ABC transporter ATP-binding protein [Bacteroidetes bacterium]|nr:xylose ABC transporter ATP-binding protein [Bacteroidota bacterium]